MESKLKTQGDIEKIDKFTGYQLHNKFKIVGLGLSITSILLIITSIKVYILDVKYHELFERIVLSTMVLGLLIISISREKIEDELITKIRMQSYNYAVIAAVLVYLMLPLIHNAIEFCFSSIPKSVVGSKDLSILAFLLSIQILTFRKLKKAYNEE